METEKSKQMRKDIELLDDLAHWIRAYCYEVEACGRSGELEMGRIKELVPVALKALVNYL